MKILLQLLWACNAIAVVKITVDRRLKPIKSRELLIKKVIENPILTDRFIIFYCLYED